MLSITIPHRFTAIFHNDLHELEDLYEAKRVTQTQVRDLMEGNRPEMEKFWEKGGFYAPFADHEKKRLESYLEQEDQMISCVLREKEKIVAYGWYSLPDPDDKDHILETWPTKPPLWLEQAVERETIAQLELIVTTTRGTITELMHILHEQLPLYSHNLLSYYKERELMKVDGKFKKCPAVPNIASKKQLKKHGYREEGMMKPDLSKPSSTFNLPPKVEIYPLWQRVHAKR